MTVCTQNLLIAFMTVCTYFIYISSIFLEIKAVRSTGLEPTGTARLKSVILLFSIFLP